MTYEIRYTKLAEAFLGDRKGAFEERLRGELAKMLPEGYNIFDLMFHTVEYEDQDYLALGKKDHLLVDTATYEEGDAFDKGPFKGKRLMMPMPDTET